MFSLNKKYKTAGLLGFFGKRSFNFLNVSIDNETLHLNLRNKDNIKRFGGVFGIRNDNPLPYKDLNILDINNKKSTHNLYKVLESRNEFSKNQSI